MHIPANNEKQSEKKASAEVGIEKQGESDFCNSFEDNRPVAIAQRKIQDIANNSIQVKQAAQLQAIADAHTLTQKKTYTDNSTTSDKTEIGTNNKSSLVVQKVKYPTNSFGNINKPDFENEVDSLKFISRPNYTPHSDSKAGGIKSSAKLGPSRTIGHEGSKANSNLPIHINSARIKYPTSNFVAGHLLNGEFGGDGQDSDNLTILSHQGNMNHKGFDQPVKHAQEGLVKAYRVLYDNDIDMEKAKIGIEINVMVDTNKPWPDETRIFQTLNCNAKLVKEGTAPSSEFDKKPFSDFQLALDDVTSDLSKAKGNIYNQVGVAAFPTKKNPITKAKAKKVGVKGKKKTYGTKKIATKKHKSDKKSKKAKSKKKAAKKPAKG